MKPLGASGACEVLCPQVLTPRFSAVSITTFGLSTWQVMISQPESTSALVASASRTGMRPFAGEHHLHDGLRVGLAGAEQHRVDVAEHGGDRLGGDEADLVGGGGQAGGDAVDVVALVQVAEVAARVHRVLVLRPQRSGVAELDGGKLLGRVHDERLEIAERGGEDEVGAVQVDHGLHGLGDGHGLGNILFLDHLHARTPPSGPWRRRHVPGSNRSRRADPRRRDRPQRPWRRPDAVETWPQQFRRLHPAAACGETNCTTSFDGLP